MYFPWYIVFVTRVYVWIACIFRKMPTCSNQNLLPGVSTCNTAWEWEISAADKHFVKYNFSEEYAGNGYWYGGCAMDVNGKNVRKYITVLFLHIRSITYLAIWSSDKNRTYRHRPLTRYVKLRVAHTPGMPGTIPPLQLQRGPLISDLACITARTSRKCRDVCRDC